MVLEQPLKPFPSVMLDAQPKVFCQTILHLQFVKYQTHRLSVSEIKKKICIIFFTFKVKLPKN